MEHGVKRFYWITPAEGENLEAAPSRQGIVADRVEKDECISAVELAKEVGEKIRLKSRVFDLIG